MFISLRARFVLLIAMATVITAGMLTWDFVVDRDHLIDGAKETLLSHTKLIAARQQSIVNRADAMLNGLMLSASVAPGSSSAACTSELAAWQRAEPQFQNVTKALPNGDLVCTARGLEAPINVADRAYFRAALKRPEMVVSDVFIGRVLGQRSIAFAKAMRDGSGGVTGVLILILDLDWLGRELAVSNPPEGTRLVVADANGDVAVSLPADEKLIGTNLGPSEIFRNIRDAQAPGAFESNHLGGEARLFAHVTLLETVSGPMYLWASVPLNSVVVEAKQHSAIKFGVAVGVLLVVMGLVIRSVNRLVVYPMEKLAESARRFSQGDLNARSGLRHTRNELGQLALAIDQAGLMIAKRARSAARANRGLSVLYAGNRAVQRATNERALLEDMCRVIVRAGGYRFATVAYLNPNSARAITAMAWFGDRSQEASAGATPDGDQDDGQPATLMARTIRSGKPRVCRDIASDQAFAPWRDAALARGYAANIVLPLVDGDRTIGGLSIYAAEVRAFDEQETVLLTEMANQLAAGINMLRTRSERDRNAHAHEHHLEILEQSLEQSIQAIAATVEARDPYTAGHEHRVGEIAVAIARELGLSEDEIRGIRLAATVHDLGKIQVPAEILAKPGRLTEIEFMLIKNHPQAGYDILKDVEFPWPIAQVVLQHHERMDGSGYPQGLKGNQIMFESRIVAVADVVEAMSSHRPYRPSIGTDAALAEIERGSGTLYDPKVAEACLRVFRDRGFVSEKSSGPSVVPVPQPQELQAAVLADATWALRGGL